MHDAPVLHGADRNISSTVRFTGRPSASHPCMDPSADDLGPLTHVR